MNKKLTIVGITILLLSCTTIFGQSQSKFKIFAYSGLNFPVYPSTGFASFLRPAANIGVGLNYQLSSKLSIALDFNHSQFKPTAKNSWRIDHDGHGIIFIEDHFSSDIIEVDYERNDLILELKLKPFNCSKGISPYILAGAGANFRRIEAYQFGFHSISWLKSNTIHYLVTAGLGLDYQIENKINIFLEACYNYSFFDLKEKNRGIIPIKLGIALGL